MKKFAPKHRAAVLVAAFAVVGSTLTLLLSASQITDIRLSRTSIDEGVLPGAIVGNLSVATSSTGNGVHPNPYDYRIIPDFEPEVNLPTQAMRDAHSDWWTLYNEPDEFYQDPPAVLFGPGDLSSESHGTYSYARAGGYYLQGIVDFIRTTGDPAALDELVDWSHTLRDNLKDHDGRGYEFFQYMNQNFNKGYNKPYDPKYEESDTNFLDEQMLAGNLALIAHVMHQNRDVNAEAGEQADIWFDYLANNWTPKWLARTTVNKPHEYTPPSSLGLQNAVNWDHPTNPRHDDTHPSFDPLDSDWTPADDDGQTADHQFPVRQFGHPYLMSLFQYHVMAEYFASGAGTANSRAFDAADFELEAQIRHDWWYQQTTPQSDGSRDWWLNMQTSNAGLRSANYSQHVASFTNALHWVGYGNFARNEDMASYAKAWYAGPNAGSTDVYNPGNINTMRLFTDGKGGNTSFVMRFAALMGCWDDTGEILRLNDLAIAGGPLAHKIGGGTRWGDFSHYDAILSCELKQLSDAGNLNSQPSDQPTDVAYSLVDGQGSEDNNSFSVDGNTLRIQISPDYETKTDYTVRIRAATAEQSFEDAYTITVIDIAEDKDDIPSEDPIESEPLPILGQCDLQFTAIGTGGGVASTYDLNFGPSNVHDDSLANDSRWSRQGTGAYLDLDLGTQAQLGGIRVAFAFGGTRTSTFEVLTSTDSLNYEPIDPDQESGLYTSSGTTSGYEDYGIPNYVDTRYVRIIGYGNSVTDWNSITEIKLCGELNEQPAYTADLTNDGSVNISDLVILLRSWGGQDIDADLNSDGIVNIIDLSIMLTSWTS